MIKRLSFALLIALMVLSSHGQEEVIAEPVEPHWTEAYKYNGIIHLYIIGPASVLNDTIPITASKGNPVLVSEAVYDEEGNVVTEAVYRQQTVKEFIGGDARVNLSPDGSQAIIFACSMDAPLYRMKKFNKRDAEEWKMFATFVWGDVAKLITRAEKDAILAEWRSEDANAM